MQIIKEIEMTCDFTNQRPAPTVYSIPPNRWHLSPLPHLYLISFLSGPLTLRVQELLTPLPDLLGSISQCRPDD